MLKKHDVGGRDNGGLRRKHLDLRGHPGRRNDVVPQGDGVLDVLVIQFVRGAFDLDDGFVETDGVVAVLEVEAVGDVGAVLGEDTANGPVDGVLDGQGLFKRPRG